MSSTAFWVVGVDASRRQRVRELLGHGDDPVRLLARAGYATPGPSSVVGDADPHTVVVVYPVVPDPGPAGGAVGNVPHDPGMVLAPGEEQVLD